MKLICSLILVLKSSFLLADICEKKIPLPSRFDETFVAERLQDDGVTAYVHAAVSDQNIILISVKNPDSKVMFDTLEFPVIGYDDKLSEVVRKLKRHDKVCVLGTLSKTNGKPVSHLFMTNLKILKPSPVDARGYAYEKSVLEELKTKSQIIAKVHISLNEGKVFVIEYKDRVIPIPVKNTALTKDLYRGDKILLKYKVKAHPNAPLHLEIDEDAKEPLTVISALKDQNGKQFVLQGSLVLYPKNAQTSQDVYAVQIKDVDGFSYDYFLLSEDEEVFFDLQRRLTRVWTVNRTKVIQGRNRLLLPSIRVKAKGRVQVVSKKQGNPQIALNSELDLELISAK